MSVKNLLNAYMFKPKLGPLELLVLQGTPFCNLDCSYCYLPDRRSTKKMSHEILAKTIESVLSANIVGHSFTVLWHAGEPMTLGINYYESAIKTIKCLVPAHIKVHYSIQTNGTLIDDKWCSFFRKHRFGVGVSIDGPAHIHDIYRLGRDKRPTHHKTMLGIEKLRKYNIPFSTIAVLTKEALRVPDQMYDFFNNLGTWRACFNVEEIEGIHSSSSLALDGSTENFAGFFAKMFERHQKSGSAMQIRELLRFESSVLGWTPQKSQELQARGTQENAPFKILSVDWQGDFSTYSPELLGMDIKPYGKFILGNILKTKLIDVLSDKRFLRIAADVRKGVQMCKRTCEYFSICGGGAPANKYYENGSFVSSETMHCRLAIKTIAEVYMNAMEKNGALIDYFQKNQQVRVN